MKKIIEKSNPAWLFLIVALAILPCFSEKRIGLIFNGIIGLGAPLGFPPLPSSFIISATFLYFITVIYFIILLFKKNYDTRMIFPISIMAILKLLIGFEFIEFAEIFSNSDRVPFAFDKLVMFKIIFSILVNLIIICYIIISVIPKFEKTKKFFKKIWFIPAIFKIISCIFDILTTLLFSDMTARGGTSLDELKKFIRWSFSNLNSFSWVNKIAVLAAFIEILAIFLFSYKLVNCKYIVRNKEFDTNSETIAENKILNEKNIIKSTRYSSVCVWIIPAIAAFAYIVQLMNWEEMNIFDIIWIPAWGLIALGVIIHWCFDKMQLVVTDKRVYGKVAFGKRVDLPLDSVSSVGTSALWGIDVGTSSGKIHFKLIKNKNEIHSELSKLLTERQETKNQKNFENEISSNVEELKKYKDLFDCGIITQEEFEKKKKQILDL